MSYYLSINGATEGPYDLGAIEAEFRAKRLDPSMLCWTDRWPHWKTIGEAFPQWSQTTTQGAEVARPLKRRIKSPYGIVEWLKLVVVLIGGVVTSCALGGLMAVGEILSGFSIYGWTLWFVIPIGAIFAGMGGAAGCYYTALWIHYYPRFLFFIGVVGLAMLTLVTTHYLIFTNLLRDVALLQDYEAFFRHLIFISNDVTLESVSGPKHGPVVLGKLSIWYYMLQVLGFSVGGMLIYGILRSYVFCRTCNRYPFVEQVAELHDLSAEGFTAHFDRARALMIAGHYHEALRLHPMKRSLEKMGITEGFRSSIISYHCAGCAAKTYRHTAFRFSTTWDELSTLQHDFTDDGSMKPPKSI